MTTLAGLQNAAAALPRRTTDIVEESPKSPLGGYPPLEVDVPLAEDRGGTCFYAVDVAPMQGVGAARPWRVWRRYTDFRQLLEHLDSADAADGLPPFPGRTLFPVAGAAKSRIEARRRKLGQWLRAAVARLGAAAPDTVRSFLQSGAQWQSDGVPVGCIRVAALNSVGSLPFSLTRIRLILQSGAGAGPDELPAGKAAQCDCSSAPGQLTVRGGESAPAPRWLLGRQPPFSESWSTGRLGPGEWVRIRLSNPRHIARVVIDGIGGTTLLRVECWPDSIALGQPVWCEDVGVRCVRGGTPAGKAFAELIPPSRGPPKPPREEPAATAAARRDSVRSIPLLPQPSFHGAEISRQASQTTPAEDGSPPDLPRSSPNPDTLTDAAVVFGPMAVARADSIRRASMRQQSLQLPEPRPSPPHGGDIFPHGAYASGAQGSPLPVMVTTSGALGSPPPAYAPIWRQASGLSAARSS
eukprot:TRINITY_DN16938_c0_g1_i1.p1 TRINITY_DN16938_c0_g1~~TRINITY_DN16938_c0_g1_i1.p1  ORF type:complete len:500 (+),score=125.40 TRINITY_DN16938_c0_g1_i1:98-1501(+)